MSKKHREVRRIDVSMSNSEAEGFIAKQELMRLATVDTEGKPHAAPLWYVYDNGRIYFSADKGSKKLKNMKDKKDVAVLLDEGTKLFKVKGILVLGKARIIADQKRIKKVRRLFAEKYFGSEDHEDFQRLDYFMKNQTFVEITPGKKISWDYAKWKS